MKNINRRIWGINHPSVIVFFWIVCAVDVIGSNISYSSTLGLSSDDEYQDLVVPNEAMDSSFVSTDEEYHDKKSAANEEQSVAFTGDASSCDNDYVDHVQEMNPELSIYTLDNNVEENAAKQGQIKALEQFNQELHRSFKNILAKHEINQSDVSYNITINQQISIIQELDQVLHSFSSEVENVEFQDLGKALRVFRDKEFLSKVPLQREESPIKKGSSSISQIDTLDLDFDNDSNEVISNEFDKRNMELQYARSERVVVESVAKEQEKVEGKVAKMFKEARARAELNKKLDDINRTKLGDAARRKAVREREIEEQKKLGQALQNVIASKREVIPLRYGEDVYMKSGFAQHLQNRK